MATKKIEMPKVELTDEQRKEIEEERRQQQAMGQRANIALGVLNTIIKHPIEKYPSTKEQIAADVRIAKMYAEEFMDKMLGIKFEKN